MLFQFDGEGGLADFSLHGFFRGEVGVFDELLRDCGRALLYPTGVKVFVGGLCDAFKGDAVVGVEIFVLDTYKRPFGVGGQRGEGDVGVFRAGDFVVVCVEEGDHVCVGGKARGIEFLGVVNCRADRADGD